MDVLLRIYRFPDGQRAVLYQQDEHGHGAASTCNGTLLARPNEEVRDCGGPQPKWLRDLDLVLELFVEVDKEPIRIPERVR